MKPRDGLIMALAKWSLRVGFLVFSVLPVYACLIIALTPLGNVMEPQLYPKFWAIANLVVSFKYIVLRMINSLVYSLFSVLFVLVIAVPSAYVLARYHFRGRDASLFGLLLTQMMAGIVILPSIYTMYSKLKLVDSPYGLVFVLMGANLALAVWVLYGFFQTLPKEIEEAALIDGCSYVGTLIRVIVPISGPGIAVGAIFVFINSYNEFVIPLFLLTDARLQTITMTLYSLLTDTTMRWELLAGCSLVVIIPPVVIFFLFERYIVSGLTSGAVKN